MPQDDHPGFEYWRENDAAHAFPVGPITLEFGLEDGAAAHAEFALPQTQPHASTVAERSIGIAHSCKLWFALECTTDAQGNVVCEAVLRGQHVHWFPDHGESASGPLQEIRLSGAELLGGGRKSVIAGHGPHCDTFSVTWFQVQGKLRCDLVVLHWRMSEREFAAAQEEAKHSAKHKVIIEIPPLPDPDEDPAPAPEPGPLPES